MIHVPPSCKTCNRRGNCPAHEYARQMPCKDYERRGGKNAKG